MVTHLFKNSGGGGLRDEKTSTGWIEKPVQLQEAEDLYWWAKGLCQYVTV